MLFPKWQGVVNLPALPERRKRIGSNLVIQRLFMGAQCKAQIFDCDVRGHDLIRTDLSEPYREILLRRKGARRQPTSLPVVSCVEAGHADTWPKQLTIAWDRLGYLESYGDTPEKVLQSWANAFNFRTEDEKAGTPGLRTPQIGALHAISAHFAVGNEFEAATVVLPTGTGKTETMLATQVYRRLERTLVLVPSDNLRSQIGNKIASLGVLPDAGVVPREIARPHVAIISGGIKTVVNARSIIEHANIVVALPNALQASNPEAAATLSSHAPT